MGKLRLKEFKWHAEGHRASGTRSKLFPETPPHLLLVSKVSSTGQPCSRRLLLLSTLGCVFSAPFVWDGWPSPGVGGWGRRQWEYKGGYVREVFPEKIGKGVQSLGKISTVLRRKRFCRSGHRGYLCGVCCHLLISKYIYILYMLYLLFTCICIQF